MILLMIILVNIVGHDDDDDDDFYDGDDDDDCSLLVRRSVPDDQAEQETDSACYKIGHPPALSLFSLSLFYFKIYFKSTQIVPTTR